MRGLRSCEMKRAYVFIPAAMSLDLKTQDFLERRFNVVSRIVHS